MVGGGVSLCIVVKGQFCGGVGLVDAVKMHGVFGKCHRVFWELKGTTQGKKGEIQGWETVGGWGVCRGVHGGLPGFLRWGRFSLLGGDLRIEGQGAWRPSGWGLGAPHRDVDGGEGGVTLKDLAKEKQRHHKPIFEDRLQAGGKTE